MEAKLDALLELVREPEPADDAFVDGTLTAVRANDERHARRRRLATRPTALAVAAVVVISGAVAAVVQVNDAAEQRRTRTTPTEQAQPAAPDDRDAPLTEDTWSEPRFTEDTEWGYADDTTAYAVDHETGLRLQTKVSDTHIDAGTPQTVLVTLTNTGERAVAVEAARDCALLVGASLANEGSAEESAHTWQCAATTDASETHKDDRFVLEPGDHLAGQASIALGAAGDWRLVGMCRCTFRSAGEPTPKPDAGDPLDGVPPLLSATTPLLPPHDRPAENGSQGLVTPPIIVRAR